MRVDPNYVVNLAAAVDQSTANETTLTSELSSGLPTPRFRTTPSP